MAALKPLEACAETGNIDYNVWPALLLPLIEQLRYIAHNEFPIPRPYPVVNPVLPSQRSTEHDRFDNPPTLLSNTPSTPRTLPPVPPFPGSSASRVPDSQPAADDAQEDQAREELPIEVVQLLEQSLKTLRTCFEKTPPHTIQRLSELVLYPTKHYRTLPAWLRALDRVVSVSSGADVFPLSDIPPDIGNGIINGTDIGGILFSNSSNEPRNGYDRDSLGSDESLGGALLTPIPWLKDADLSSETDTSLDSSSKIETWNDQSPDEDMLILPDTGVTPTANAAQAIAAVAVEQNREGSIPQRADGAVTQGELIRMEQTAGVVPVPQERFGDEGIELDDEDEKIPHARGPDLVGTVDMGKVAGEERILRISSPPGGPHEDSAQVDANDAQEVLSGGTTANKGTKVEKIKEGSPPDDYVKIEKEDVKDKTRPSSDDGDIVLVDADGTTGTSQR